NLSGILDEGRDIDMTEENTDISQLITQAKKGNLTAQLTLAGGPFEDIGGGFRRENGWLQNQSCFF
ncbi:MAG: hypothetical protein ACE1ZE_04110, partial [Candidatus Binatia bacterium]